MHFSIDDTFAFAKRIEVVAAHAKKLYDVDLLDDVKKFDLDDRKAMLNKLGEYEGIFPELILGG